ncbi:hypothetical protein PS723_01893 [Pseudomonas fluorescens]|uniref:Uncharacterized protein n=1 Tax=Pseudomonas fluorescens TaxID=294 RepID=A0A5E7BIE6_PSEFL|nr:hypothetical protein PS723_01893 [Pseudomonas fluorescens]
MMRDLDLNYQDLGNISAVMGVAEGAFTPTSIAATAEASHPRRLGVNIGIQQAFFPLLGPSGSSKSFRVVSAYIVC